MKYFKFTKVLSLSSRLFLQKCFALRRLECFAKFISEKIFVMTCVITVYCFHFIFYYKFLYRWARQNIMYPPHWNFNSFLKHLISCDTVGFLIRSLFLVGSTILLHFSYSWGKMRFEWLWMSMIMDARRVDSSIWNVVNIIGFSRPRMSRVFKELHLI